MAERFQVLRCYSCRAFQVQQVKRSRRWSCAVCGERQALLRDYGRGCAADCRRHVQKLNWLRGEAEQAARAAARKHGSSFHSSDAQEHCEENRACGLTYQAKKVKAFESRKTSVAVTEQDHEDVLRDSIVVPAPSQPLVSEASSRVRSCHVTASKWKTFLSSTTDYVEDEGKTTLTAHKLEPLKATAADFPTSDGSAQWEEESLSPDAVAQIKNSFNNNKCTAQQHASKPHSTAATKHVKTAFNISSEAAGDMTCGNYEDHLMGAGSAIAEKNKERLCVVDRTVMPASKLSEACVTPSAGSFVSCNVVSDPLTTPYNGLFCTGDDFDDDL